MSQSQHRTRNGLAAALSLAILVAVALAGRNEPGPTAGQLTERVYLPLIVSNFPPNLLENPDFEQGIGGGCRYLDGAGVEHFGCFIEQRVPAHWTLFWRQDQAGALCHSGVTGRPEANLSDRRHPEDVYEGDYSAHAFTFWRCASFHWEQAAATEPGRGYEFGGYVRTWPGNPQMRARLCAGDVCTQWVSTDGAWLALTLRFEAAAETVVRAEFSAAWPNYVNNDGWIDSFWLYPLN